MEDLGTLIGSIAGGVVVLIGALYKAEAKIRAELGKMLGEQPKRVAAALCTDDGEDEHRPAELRSLLREELEPVRREQRRQRKQLRAQGVKLDALVADADIARDRADELSARLAEIEDSDDGASESVVAAR